MKVQNDKTIAELIILKEMLKMDLDRILKELDRVDNANMYLKISHELIDTNEKIMLIQDLLRKLMK